DHEVRGDRFAERSDLDSCPCDGVGGAPGRFSPRLVESLGYNRHPPTTQIPGGHIPVTTVVTGSAQHHHPGPVPHAHVDRFEAHGKTRSAHEDIDGIGGALVHPGRFGGGDYRDHSCSATATAITRAEVSVCVIVTRTSVTPSISARWAARPDIFTVGAPPPVISMSVHRIRRQPVPIDFITASLPAKRAASRRAGLAKRRAYSCSW